MNIKLVALSFDFICLSNVALILRVSSHPLLKYIFLSHKKLQLKNRTGLEKKYYFPGSVFLFECSN